MTREKATSLLLLAMLTVPLGGVAAQTGIGLASAVDGRPIGQGAAGSERVLRVGVDLQVNDRLVTGPGDRAHLVFVDGSAVTLGPDSALAIDRYSYDPAAKTGETGLRVDRGTVRFVGGTIGKGSDVEIRTPDAVLGVRGGIVTASVAPGTGTTATFIHGESLRVTSQGRTQVATRSGSQIATPPGGPPAAAIVLAPGALPGTESFERQAPGAAVAAPASLRRATGLNPTLLQADAAADAADPTPNAASPSANDTSNTQSGSGSTAEVGAALRESGLAQRNSALTPREARNVPRFDPRGGGDAPSLARAGKAGAPPEPTAFRPPHTVTSPHGSPAQKAVATHSASSNRVTTAK
ncbi:MAG: FecR family protein [Reyranellaceae bacterium]